jgi:hypothetical protein
MESRDNVTSFYRRWLISIQKSAKNRILNGIEKNKLHLKADLKAYLTGLLFFLNMFLFVVK